MRSEKGKLLSNEMTDDIDKIHKTFDLDENIKRMEKIGEKIEETEK